MTVCRMTPNSSSGAGVAGDAILRSREYGRGMDKGGLRGGQPESPQVESPGKQMGPWFQALGRREPGCVCTASASRAEELAQESRWRGGCQGLGNRHIRRVVKGTSP
jgi:hypothetical protein